MCYNVYTFGQMCSEEHPLMESEWIMSTISKGKNPLHPSALSINDMTIGRRVLCFNTEHGILNSGTIVSRPYVETRSPRSIELIDDSWWAKTHLKVDLQCDGYTRSYFLGDLGVTQYAGNGWNPANFVIDHRKEHLLPAVVVEPLNHFLYWDDDSDVLLDEEEEEQIGTFLRRSWDDEFATW